MFELDLSFWHKVMAEGGLELSPIDVFRMSMGCNISCPPIGCWASQLVGSKQYLLLIEALRYQQLAFHDLQPVVGIQWLHRLGKLRRFGAEKILEFGLGRWGWWRWWGLLVLLEVIHGCN